MSVVRQRLEELDLVLPPTPPPPVAAYVPARRNGDLIFVAGQIPFLSGELIATGPTGPASCCTRCSARPAGTSEPPWAASPCP
jgi:hypothetical protein